MLVYTPQAIDDLAHILAGLISFRIGGASIPALTQEHAEAVYDDILDNNLLNMGVCFETEEEAIEKAKQVYYRFKWDKLTKSCNVNGQFSAYYDKETNRVIPCPSKTIGERCTDTEEEMLHAIEEIGPVNYVKYILGLRGVTVYVPVSV